MGCELLMAIPLPCIMPWPPRGPKAFSSRRLGNDAAERLHETVHVGVGHGQRATAEPALGQEHAIVSNPRKVRSGRSASVGRLER